MAWFKPYVSVAQRRAKAEKLLAKSTKRGETLCPVRLEGGNDGLRRRHRWG